MDYFQRRAANTHSVALLTQIQFSTRLSGNCGAFDILRFMKFLGLAFNFKFATAFDYHLKLGNKEEQPAQSPLSPEENEVRENGAYHHLSEQILATTSLSYKALG